MHVVAPYALYAGPRLGIIALVLLLKIRTILDGE